MTDPNAPDPALVSAIAALMASAGHTLTVEDRARVRGWLGRHREAACTTR